jgi:arsenite methyltransferase
MSGGLQFDEDTSRKVESIYLTPDVVAQRSGVLKALEPRKGERFLDIGSGPGLLAYDIATLVGRDGHVPLLTLKLLPPRLTRARNVTKPSRSVRNSARYSAVAFARSFSKARSMTR